MAYTKPQTLDASPSGDTVKTAIVSKLDVNAAQIVADLNTHEALTDTHGATGAIVGTTNAQTLTNKTLTTPIVAALYQDSGKTKLITFPASSDTLVGRDTTDTLTNKTLTSPILTTPILGTPSSGNLVNCTFPTLNQNTTGNAATATTSSACSGNAATATALQNARTINGVSFNGTSNINLTTAPSGWSVTGTCSATAFSGPLTGNVTGNCSGNAATATYATSAGDSNSVDGIHFRIIAVPEVSGYYWLDAYYLGDWRHIASFQV